MDDYKVKILNKILVCNCCDSDLWGVSTVELNIKDGYINDEGRFNEQYRYVFECLRCGNMNWFGRVRDWEEGTMIIQLIKHEE